jgi:hypothetical protein
MRLWDLDSGQGIHTLEGRASPVWSVVVTSDGLSASGIWTARGVVRKIRRYPNAQNGRADSARSREPGDVGKRRPPGQRPGRIRSAIEQVFFERKVGQKGQLWTICPVENGCWRAQVEHLAELLQSATTPRFDPRISRRTGAESSKWRCSADRCPPRTGLDCLRGCSARMSPVFYSLRGRSIA